jgi:hypothetical protein
MTLLTDLSRVAVATAYAECDLDALRSLALAAIDDLDRVVAAYDRLAQVPA